MYSRRMHTAHSSTCLLGMGVCLSACWDTHPPPRRGPGDPWVWAWRPLGQTPNLPPWVWAWRPPQPDPSTSPLGVGLETPQPNPLTSPLGVGLETPWPDPSTFPLGVGLETPPHPVNRMTDRQVAGGKNWPVILSIMSDEPILPVIQAITINTMLNNNWLNNGLIF